MSKENPQGTDLAVMIFREIEKSGLSDAIIAKRMGESRQTIGRICDRKTFDLDFLQRLRDASGIDFTGYVFNPKNKKYESIDTISKVAEPNEEYVADKKVTLTMNIACRRSQTSAFSDFLLEMDSVAKKYGYDIV